MEKKKWVRPILTVLLRSKEEGTVLRACKTHLVRGPGRMNCSIGRGAPCIPPASSACDDCANLPPPPPGEGWICFCCPCLIEQHS